MWEITTSILNCKINIFRPANNNHTRNTQCKTKSVQAFRTRIVIHLSCHNNHIVATHHMEIRVCTSTHSRFSSDHFLSSCSSRDRPLSGDELMMYQHTRAKQLARLAGKLAGQSLVRSTVLAVRKPAGGWRRWRLLRSGFVWRESITMPESAATGSPHDCQHIHGWFPPSVSAWSSSSWTCYHRQDCKNRVPTGRLQ